ncbi:MAG: type II toxin-antitoxin system HicB family antitoxin [Candidatus Methanomethylicota archaeon]|uniref:Type II toxin-antitoxin system HicB family antitoxin n=1 Tax=Thermoproteota archaeon TaxID=2056631 RepID=A0A497EQL8_9CREN|nr:MAG: type II toxin-antitoxin system HicB family antitoxin [Candidatus Verstraetearchaeota archaeon]
MRGREFTVIIEQDEDGYYVASVVELPGCFTQAKTINELLQRIEDAIKLYLEAIGKREKFLVKFIGLQKITVTA